MCFFISFQVPGFLPPEAPRQDSKYQKVFHNYTFDKLMPLGHIFSLYFSIGTRDICFLRILFGKFRLVNCKSSWEQFEATNRFLTSWGNLNLRNMMMKIYSWCCIGRKMVGNSTLFLWTPKMHESGSTSQVSNHHTELCRKIWKVHRDWAGHPRFSAQISHWNSWTNSGTSW